MLYDPKWEAPVKSKPDFSGFVSFVMAQSEDRTFNINFPDECAIGQYFKSIGQRPPTLVSDAAAMFGMPEYDLYRILRGNGGYPIISFGSVAKRIRRKRFWQVVFSAVFGE
jgi:hypothetical protein